MQCRLGWWLVCRLSTSLVPGIRQLGGADFLRSPSLSLSLFGSGQNQPPAIGVRGSFLRALLGSAQLISLPRRAQQLQKIHRLPTGPSQPTLPHHHGAVTTATRWTVSCRHAASVWNTWMNMCRSCTQWLKCFTPVTFMHSLTPTQLSSTATKVTSQDFTARHELLLYFCLLPGDKFVSALRQPIPTVLYSKG